MTESTVTLRDVNTCDQQTVANDFVFAMTGGARTRRCCARRHRIDPQTSVPVHDPRSLETATPGVYIAGVLVTGSNKTFIENGREHGAMIVAAITGTTYEPVEKPNE